MSGNQIAVLLLDLVAVFAVCGLLGSLVAKLGQPPVIGELLGGVLLGPTVLGSWSGVLFPDAVRPTLGAFGNVGVALFMFALGAEFDGSAVRTRLRHAWVVAAGAMLVPFALGVGTALLLPVLGVGQRGSPTAFVLFLGVALSITAFPVLARILDDRGLVRTGVGRLALTVAALCDVLAWSALAVVVAIVSGSGGHVWQVLLLVPLVVVLRFAVGPVLRLVLLRLGPRQENAVVVLLLAGALACGAATELMGLHFIFGAFVFGLLAARSGPGPLVARVRGRVLEISRFFLPVYLVVAGLQVDIAFDPASLVLLGVVLFAATAGKTLGAFGAAKACRLRTRPATALAVLLNTRGLTELIVLSTGLQLGVIDRRQYSVMVLMALATTAATGPALAWLARRGNRLGEDPFELDAVGMPVGGARR
ncbi:cation:proton antiporter domain-containing protein [Amycolatopsis sacchari]|uniref:cation:proton antiporter domain-containing protein n=1 Tax=Amycolatopsis sacchari TaxID=115433 RepID=UPI003EBC8E63